MELEQFLQKAKKSSRVISTLSAKKKTIILNEIADALIENQDIIILENQKDMDKARRENLSSTLLERLKLDKTRIQNMAKSIREIAALKEPVGKVLEGWVAPSGLRIEKVTTPIGVIGIVYESRPNVTSDSAALCFKSGNVCVLKGGKEAVNSNSIIALVLQKILEKNSLAKEIISLLPDSSRQGVAKLIKMDDYVDLIIPRGGEALIKFVAKNSSVPVIKHDKGLCHVYVDSSADLQNAIEISINAKCQRPGVCNAMETLLIHETIAKELLPKLKNEFDKQGTKLFGCEITCKYIDISRASEEDFYTEYLDNILSIKIVKDTEEAILHINEHSSGHSESILTQNYTNGEKFLNEVDSACVYINSSTRFTDGGEFGFGAEVGISTSKLHSRGPMGINDLTTYKFKIYGKGNIRE